MEAKKQNEGNQENHSKVPPSIIVCPWCNRLIDKFNVHGMNLETASGEKLQVIQYGCIYCSKLLTMTTEKIKSPIIKV